MTKTRTRRLVLWAALTGLLVGMVGWAVATPSNPDRGTHPHAPVTICHNADGHFVEITVDDDATLVGHQAHEGDIIPAPAGGCPSGDGGETPGPGPGGGNGPAGPTPPPLTG